MVKGCGVANIFWGLSGTILGVRHKWQINFGGVAIYGSWVAKIFFGVGWQNVLLGV